MEDERTNTSPGGLAGVLRQGITNYMKDVHTALPGVIVSFNPSNQTATVQLLIKRIFKNDIVADLPQLINVPVWQPRAGGYIITFPIAKDDECLVLFSERSLDNWFKFGGAQPPKDKRLHSLSDAICLVGMSSEPTAIQNYDASNFQIRNESNNIHITLDSSTNSITILTPTKVTVDTPDVQFTGNIQVDGNVLTKGDTQINGSLNTTGTSTASDHDSGGVSGKTHKHSGVVPGGGFTGLPQ